MSFVHINKTSVLEKMVLFWRLCRQILVLATELSEIVIFHGEGDHVSTVGLQSF